MKNYSIIIGPNDATRLIAAARTAVQGTGRKFHRIQMDFATDELGNIVEDSVEYYPVDEKFNRIYSKERALISARGCPYPPDCTITNISFINKNIDKTDENFSECIEKINNLSNQLGLLE